MFQAEVRSGSEREGGEQRGEEDASEPESLSFQNLRASHRRLKEQHRQQQHHGECRLLIPVILLPVDDETFPCTKNISNLGLQRMTAILSLRWSKLV